MNYILDLERLVARKKIFPGKPDESSIFKKIADGKMPPPEVRERLTPAETATVRGWIAGGAKPSASRATRKAITAADEKELILADLQTIDKALPRLAKEARIDKSKVDVVAAVERAREVLNSGKTVFAAGLDPEPLRELHLLTAKPFVYVINADEASLVNADFRAKMRSLVAPAEAVFLDAQTEAELVELSDEEALELLQSVGQDESGLHALARVGFDTLGLQTYLTAGPKEARAWTISKGATAPEAAGVIHTDFQRGFIKAEIVSFADLVDSGSMAEAKSRGKVRIEGKEYVMADGDVVEFRFNV